MDDVTDKRLSAIEGALDGMLPGWREVGTLDRMWPGWREIVGRADAANAFREWLAGKDAAYQARINESQSAEDIAQAIQSFHTEAGARH